MISIYICDYVFAKQWNIHKTGIPFRLLLDIYEIRTLSAMIQRDIGSRHEHCEHSFINWITSKSCIMYHGIMDFIEQFEVNTEWREQKMNMKTAVVGSLSHLSIHQRLIGWIVPPWGALAYGSPPIGQISPSFAPRSLAYIRLPTDSIGIFEYQNLNWGRKTRIVLF